ncbi:MAG: glycosyltransferase family 2 protein [Clostridia bacterium]|nr:glycosyltransferase family 2 protein [Clostridia bacterium]
MKNNALVSVIIPVFNVAPYLAESLDSVIHQTYKNLEIIMIDDGSTDGSGKICDDYAAADERILVIHQENKGLSSARNIGLDRMTGEAVAFLDSDDEYQPDFFQAMMDALIRENADLVMCQFSIHHTEEKMGPSNLMCVERLLPPGVYDRIDALHALAEERINQAVWNKLYLSKLWENIRFPDGHVFEDLVTAYKVIDRCEKICVVEHILYLFRKRPGSITADCSLRNMDDHIAAYLHFESFVRENVPAVFSQEQLIHARRETLNRMITYYIYLSGKNEKEDMAYRENLKRRILEIGNETGIGDRELRRKVFYWMIRSCPWVLSSFYPIYFRIRRSVKKLFGIAQN